VSIYGKPPLSCCAAAVTGIGALEGLSAVFGPVSPAWLIPVAPSIPDEILGYSLQEDVREDPLNI
jgi:hypothetical protein